jgi:hypothetical protein
VPNRLAALPMNEVAERYLNGESPHSIAMAYGVTATTVRSRLASCGIALRSLSASQSIWRKGFPKSLEHRRKLSIAKTGKPAPKPPGFGVHLSRRMRGAVGDKHPCWRGGSEPLRNAIRRWAEYIEWRTAVFLRDDYTCQECGCRGGALEAHHRETVNSILRRFSVKSREEALDCIRLWDRNNGITVCSSCHPKVEKRDASSNST